MNKQYAPPYNTTDKIVHLVAEISEQAATITIKNAIASIPHLRKDNQIRTIHSSLAIENNSLSLTQVTDIINGKRILGAPNEIREVKNAYDTYSRLLTFNPYSKTDMLTAHKVLMADLSKEAGLFRSGGVGIFADQKLVHMAPPAQFVQGHIENLLYWAQHANVHLLIKSCVFHYEFEFIHPFDDGNGRMGRMWQTLLLMQWKSFFAWLPVEDIVRERQHKPTHALAASDKAGNCTVFVEFMLEAIRDALTELLQTDQVCDQVTDQVKKLLATLGNDTLSVKEMMVCIGLKHRPTFAATYLRPALNLGLIEMTIPDKPNSSKQKYRRK